METFLLVLSIIGASFACEIPIIKHLFDRFEDHVKRAAEMAEFERQHGKV